MNGKIKLLDRKDLIECVQIGRCKYIIAYGSQGGVSIHHANDCEYCKPNYEHSNFPQSHEEAVKLMQESLKWMSAEADK